jgi:hypothetical protein
MFRPIPLLLLVACANEEEAGPATASFELAQMQTESQRSSMSRGFYPETFRIPVYEVVLHGEQEDVVLYSGDGSYIDLAAGADSATAALSGADIEVPAGTYTRLSVMVEAPGGFEGARVSGCTDIDLDTYCTRSSFGDSAGGGGSAEEVTVDVHVEFLAPFPQALVIADGDVVNLSLVYDLTNVLHFETETGEPNAPQHYSDDVALGFQQTPTFAFVGDVPEAEIYELTVTGEVDTTAFPALDDHASQLDWHTRMWMYFEDDTPIGFANIFTTNEASEGAALRLAFGGDPVVTDNGDGSYQIENGPGSEITLVEAFERADHTGTLSVIDQSMWDAAAAGSTPKEFEYAVTRLQ